MEINEYVDVINIKYLSYCLIIGIIIVLIPVFKRKAKKNNRVISNTKYVKNTKRFKLLKVRLIFTFLLIVLSFIACMYSGGGLLARYIKVTEQTNEKYNRDIFILMDVSGSVLRLDREVCETFKELVDSLDGDRVGIMIFDSSAITLCPLTDDYDYVKQILNNIIDSIDGTTSRTYLSNGTSYGIGSSLIGDGLASCINQFVKADSANKELSETERTKIILFATDNMLAGSPIFTLKEAATLAKENKIKVYGLNSSRSTYGNHKVDFQTNMELTGGKMYDLGDTTYTKSVIKEITSLEKSILKTEKNIIKTDTPQKYFLFLLISYALYLFFEKWVLK